MKFLKKNLFSLFFLLLILPSCAIPPALTYFDYNSASVLPFYTVRRTKYVILSRERWGKDKGTYDDFGGKRDQGERHPLITAAREFWEEAALRWSLDLTLEQTKNFINPTKTRNTHFVVAHTTKRGAKNVTYITDFRKYKTQFLNNFYKASHAADHHQYKEKDRIAIVQWDTLKRAIIEQKTPHSPVYVDAQVLHPRTNARENQKILLRPYLVIKLRQFFRDEPYTKGKHRTIRFYS